MPKTHDQEILDYLCRPEALPQVLTVVQRASDIRSRLCGQFWSELVKYLEENTPTSLRGCSMAFEFYPDAKRMGNSNAGVYYRDTRLSSQRELVSFYISQQEQYFFYLSVEWKNPQNSDSPLLKLPEVVKLTESLQNYGFAHSKWSVGYKEIYHRDSAESFLLEYYERKEQMLQEISEQFWAMVKDTFELVGNANRALMKAKG